MYRNHNILNNTYRVAKVFHDHQPFHVRLQDNNNINAVEQSNHTHTRTQMKKKKLEDEEEEGKKKKRTTLSISILIRFSFSFGSVHASAIHPCETLHLIGMNGECRRHGNSTAVAQRRQR